MNYEDVKPGSLLDEGGNCYLMRYPDGSGWWLFCCPPEKTGFYEDDKRGWSWDRCGPMEVHVVRDDLNDAECFELATKFCESSDNDRDREALAAWLIARDGDRDTYVSRATEPEVGTWVKWDDVPGGWCVRACADGDVVYRSPDGESGAWVMMGGGWEWRGHCAAGTRALVLARVDADIDVSKLQGIARVAMASELIADRWAARVRA